MAAKGIGVPWKRVVASLLIQESGAYRGTGCEEYTTTIARLDPRLWHEPLDSSADLWDDAPPAD